MNDLTILTLILISHSISDIGLQTQWIGLNKQHNPFAMIAHCAIVAGVYYLLLGIRVWEVPITYRPLLWVFWFQFITHYAIDSTTVRFKGMGYGKWMIIDVALHFTVGIITWLIIRRS